MKTMTALAVLVMAATGCETTKPLSHFNTTAEYMAQFAQDPSKPYFGDGRRPQRQEAPAPVVSYNGPPPPASVFNAAPIYVPPAQIGSPAPQPVVVVGPGSGTTITSQTGVGTVTSSFGGYRPIVTPVPYPYYGY